MSLKYEPASEPLKNHLNDGSDDGMPRRGASTGQGDAARSYLRLIDSCITQRKAQGPSRICNESKEEEEEGDAARRAAERGLALNLPDIEQWLQRHPEAGSSWPS